MGKIWLAGTLGRKAWKKYSKKEILEQEIAALCQQVITPPIPLNFATLGILMYGVCKIYEFQVAFVLKASNESYTKLIRFVSKRVEKPQKINLPTTELQTPSMILHYSNNDQLKSKLMISQISMFSKK